jgi:hypothetical protein
VVLSSTRRSGYRFDGCPAQRSRRKDKDKSRTVPFRPPDKLQARFAPNVVRNQKYNVLTFLPLVFYEQFKFFFNLYFLLVALSQFVPALKIGFLATYVAPLAFVLAVTMGKEAYDDYQRNQRDREANSARYVVLDAASAAHRTVSSAAIRVGDFVLLEKNQRVPADLVLLRTSDVAGTCFIRTDQLDGETDWKLRVAVPSTQKAADERTLVALDAEVYGAPPVRVHARSLTACHSGRADQGHPHFHRHLHATHARRARARTTRRGRAACTTARHRAALGREHAVGEHGARCGLRRRPRRLHRRRDARGDEHEPPEDQGRATGRGDQQARQGALRGARARRVGPGGADARRRSSARSRLRSRSCLLR